MNVTVVSINAGIDHVLFFDGVLTRGAVNRQKNTLLTRGSKGATVAAVLEAFGVHCSYVSVTGGAMGPFCEEMARADGMDCFFVKTAAGVRVNEKLVEGDGTVTECNEKGGPLVPQETESLVATVQKTAPDVLFLCGSLPLGVPVDFYVTLSRAVRAVSPHCHVVVDAAGDALRAVAEAGVADLIKPNATELAELLCRPEPTTEEQVRELVALARAQFPLRAVICTCAGKGALFDDGICRHFEPPFPVEKVVSTVGAGDTFLAVFFATMKKTGDKKRSMQAASKAAASKIMLPVGQIPKEVKIQGSENTADGATKPGRKKGKSCGTQKRQF